jgi:hypothetical protein
MRKKYQDAGYIDSNDLPTWENLVDTSILSALEQDNQFQNPMHDSEKNNIK